MSVDHFNGELEKALRESVIGSYREVKDIVDNKHVLVPKENEREIINCVSKEVSGFDKKIASKFLSSGRRLQELETIDSLGKYYEGVIREEARMIFYDKCITYEGSEYDADPVEGRIVFPEELDSISNVYMCRELIRYLKNCNPIEYNSRYVYDEVLPIFHELIYSADNPGKRGKYVLGSRVDDLKRMSFIKNEIYKKQIVPDEMLDYAFIEFDTFNLGYYYAMLLYDMYTVERNLTLGLASRVMRNKMTTEEMLKYLDCDISKMGTFTSVHRSLVYKL